MLEAGASLRLVKEAMKAELFAGGYIQADETRVPVQVRTSEGVNHTGYFWQYSRPGGPVVYDLQIDRRRAGPRAFLAYYEGVLQTDGYTAYDKVGGAGIRRACCLAHVRRKFYETLQVDPGNAEAGFALLKIGEIYAVEQEAREAGLDAAGHLWVSKLWARSQLGEKKVYTVHVRGYQSKKAYILSWVAQW